MSDHDLPTCEHGYTLLTGPCPKCGDFMGKPGTERETATQFQFRQQEIHKLRRNNIREWREAGQTHFTCQCISCGHVWIEGGYWLHSKDCSFYKQFCALSDLSADAKLQGLTDLPPQRQKLVVIESPYRNANPQLHLENLRYLDEAVRDCLRRNEVPIASHLIYPHYLDDNNDEERVRGIAMNERLIQAADLVALYTGLRGMTVGMEHGLRFAERNGKPVESRK